MGQAATARRRRYHAPIGHHPTWLLGDWTPLVRDPVDLLRLSFLVGAAITAVQGEWEQALRLALTFGVTLVPRLLEVPRLFDLAFCIGMAFQAWGNVFGGFQHVHGYDKVVHFVLPASTAALLYLVLIRLSVVPDLAAESGIHQRIGTLIVTFSLGLSVGAIYECYEWFANHVLGGHLYVSYGDTIGDLLDDALGSLAGGLLVVVWDVYGWGTRRRVPGRRIAPASR